MWKKSKQGISIHNIYLLSDCGQENILKLNFKANLKVIKQVAACK